MNKMLSAKEVCQFFFNGHVSYWKLLNMAKSGEIPTIRVGSRYLFNIDSLNEWAKSRELSLASNDTGQLNKCS
ncbi:helix-turn-helix domain-containing protein [Succinispira mobilis]|uniref:helix-turn-helix domain-containing protein n=1 Tax=Succinispira mobilis TaxID=78120 RepID=UPI000369FF0E|nr:helix-turn-helix domain-containing protein [Succinispira mobilis]